MNNNYVNFCAYVQSPVNNPIDRVIIAALKEVGVKIRLLPEQIVEKSDIESGRKIALDVVNVMRVKSRMTKYNEILGERYCTSLPWVVERTSLQELLEGRCREEAIGSIDDPIARIAGTILAVTGYNNSLSNRELYNIVKVCYRHGKLRL